MVAAVDRGNYPLVNFEASEGRTQDWFPAVLALSADRRLYGWKALAQHGESGWTIVRSLKRYLKDAGPHSEIEIAGQRLNLRLATTEMMAALRRELMESSSLGAAKSDRLQAMLGVPANANSNQRFLTEEAARAAGFEVLGLSNEPSAAAVEFAHRNSTDGGSRAKGGVVVYDMGGGTFDASLVALGETEYSVVASEGISDLGGDDFDEILAKLALRSAGISAEEQKSLTPAEQFLLLDECREKKESLNPNSRKVTVDLEQIREGWSEVSIAVDVFYEQCRPLIEASRTVVESLLAVHPEHGIDTLYLTGGASELPPIARVLRENFGRKVRRSPYMRSATAIGLAIRAAEREGRTLRDQFTKNFGVWREADAGHNVTFDVIFPRGIKLPRRGQEPLKIVRRYQPAHNIGHFRYLECAHLDSQRQPHGEISNWDDIRVPFDRSLRDCSDLEEKPVLRFTAQQDLVIEEEYTCDSNGNVKVRISDRIGEYAAEYRLGHWSRNGKRAKPH